MKGEPPMKKALYSLIFALVAVVQTAWPGTTQVVLQNDFDGGYKGCQDAYIDPDWDVATGQEEHLNLLYELCVS